MVAGTQVRRVGIAALRRQADEQQKLVDSNVPTGTAAASANENTAGLDVSRNPEQQASVTMTRTNAIQESSSGFVDVKVACNAIKTFAPAVSASQGNAADTKKMIEAGEDIAYHAITLLGINKEDFVATNMARLLPDAVHAASELYLEDPDLLNDAATIHRVGEAMAIAGSSAQAGKLLSRIYKSVDALGDIRISAIAASSSLVSEIVLYRFDEDISVDIEFAMAAALDHVRNTVGKLTPPDSSEEAIIPLAQSLIRNGFAVMATCWRRQAAIASRAGFDRQKDANSGVWRQRVLDDFSVAANAVVALTARFVNDPTRDEKKRGKRRASLSL